MSGLQVFDHIKFGTIRAVERNGEPWLVAADVCRALELEDVNKAISRLDDDEGTRIEIPHPQSHGKTLTVNAVNEPGLYSLVMGSRKPEAKAFKRWITHEVLPSIRKHGAYMTPATLEAMIADPDTTIRLLSALKSEQEQRKALEAQAAENAPKVLFADSVSASTTSILVGELAKLLKQNGVDIGQNRLFQWLRNKGYLIRRHGKDYNMPTQKSMELGLFEIKETAISHAYGNITLNKTPRVTGKGQRYFIGLFLNDKAGLGGDAV